MNIFKEVKEQVTARQAAEFYGLQVNRSGKAKCIFHDDHNPSMKVDSRFHCFGCQADGDVIDLVGKLFGLTPYEAALKLASDFGIYVPDRSAGAAVHKTHGSEAGRNSMEQPSTEDTDAGNPDIGKTAEENSNTKDQNMADPDTGAADEEQKKDRQEDHGKGQKKSRKKEQKEQEEESEEKSEEKKKERRIRRLERQIRSWIERAEITLIQYLILLEEWEKKYCPKEAGEDLHPLFCEAVSRKSIVRYQLDTLLHGTDEDRLDFSRRKERG